VRCFSNIIYIEGLRRGPEYPVVDLTWNLQKPGCRPLLSQGVLLLLPIFPEALLLGVGFQGTHNSGCHENLCQNPTCHEGIIFDRKGNRCGHLLNDPYICMSDIY